ncbi:hypothetical protein BCR39DRAFT_540203 [Naematelia encephala]|uniref:NAD(P)-binding domain-containing protein n=1 Tax=Naematelia encephala TaxID=71784 RepID=A0A1Y2AWG0_9TREE|nr:hypothetical protein BCR39DRAFT_540203 [Naematelia encephala]
MSDSQPLDFFFIGATGYVGGTLLTCLMSAYPTSKFAVQYRQPDHLERIKQTMPTVRPVLASFDDFDTLRDESVKADIVVNAGSCDSMPLIRAIIAGLEEASSSRQKAGKSKAILLHTSGTNELSDKSTPPGKKASVVINDADLAQIASIPADRDHREIDVAVVNAFERGAFTGYICMPSTVFGKGTGHFKVVSDQIPRAVQYALSTGRAAYIAPGENVCSSIHNQALSQLFHALLKQTLASTPPPPENGFTHFLLATSSGPTITWKELAEKIGDILARRGLIKQGGAVGLDLNDVTDQSAFTTLNNWGISKRAKALVGWESFEKVEDHLEDEITGILAAIDKHNV